MSWPFKHTCVINLDSRPDRWARIEAHLERLGIGAQRFAAVSMHDLADDQPCDELKLFLLRTDGQSEQSDHKLRATWACMRSHLAVIARAKSLGWPEVVILEDDCEFESYAPAVMRHVHSQLQGREWSMLYLGGTPKKGGEQLKVSRNLFSVSRVRLAHAYVVKADLYERILEEAPRSGLPLDWYYSEVLLPAVRGLMVYPELARQRLMDVSDIEQVVRLPKLKTRQRLQRFIANLRYGRIFH
ncbi:glycosyltransferase family 25 protein [Pseudomonas zhanjiangensis]|uniref:Glycosyltransferase family 25 protein n=1 Tax=Pseudomonas zhanjiangensis TaxID=3239015 RepID=A0ABV3YRP8_9PSED